MSSGIHQSPRTAVALPKAEAEAFRRDAQREGITLVDWLVEAGRAYAILSERDLSEGDWLRIMGDRATLERAAERAKRSTTRLTKGRRASKRDR